MSMNIVPNGSSISHLAIKDYVDASISSVDSMNYSVIIDKLEDGEKLLGSEFGQLERQVISNFVEYMLEEHSEEFLKFMKRKVIKKELKNGKD